MMPSICGQQAGGFGELRSSLRHDGPCRRHLLLADVFPGRARYSAVYAGFPLSVMMVNGLWRPLCRENLAPLQHAHNVEIWRVLIPVGAVFLLFSARRKCGGSRDWPALMGFGMGLLHPSACDGEQAWNGRSAQRHRILVFLAHARNTLGVAAVGAILNAGVVLMAAAFPGDTANTPERVRDLLTNLGTIAGAAPTRRRQPFSIPRCIWASGDVSDLPDHRGTCFSDPARDLESLTQGAGGVKAKPSAWRSRRGDTSSKRRSSHPYSSCRGLRSCTCIARREESRGLVLLFPRLNPRAREAWLSPTSVQKGSNRAPRPAIFGLPRPHIPYCFRSRRTYVPQTPGHRYTIPACTHHWEGLMQALGASAFALAMDRYTHDARKHRSHSHVETAHNVLGENRHAARRSKARAFKEVYVIFFPWLTAPPLTVVNSVAGRPRPLGYRMRN